MDFTPGQRWHSLTEPELGLGLVEAVEGRQVVMAFPARDVVRRYATGDPPLARSRLTEGQQARDRDGAWVEPFDPADDSDFNDFAEADSWIYSWFVPHDVPALVEAGVAGQQKKISNFLFFRLPAIRWPSIF